MKKILNNEQITHYSKRIVHYLTGVRKRGKYSQSDVADMLDMSLPHYKKMEAEAYQENGRFLNSIEFLYVLASLEDFSFHEFAYYLENPNKTSYEDFKYMDKTGNERKAYGWEKNLLAAFQDLDIDMRTEFFDNFLLGQKDFKKLERLIKLALILDDSILSKIGGLDEKIFDGLLEYIFTKIKGKSSIRSKNALTLLKSILP